MKILRILDFNCNYDGFILVTDDGVFACERLEESEVYKFE